MSKVLKIIAFILIVAGLFYAGYSLFFKEKPEDETEIIKAEEKKEGDKTTKKKEAALPVKALQIKRGNLPLRLNISATSDVWEKTTVRSETNGTIERINAEVGDWVARNQLLVKLDDVEKQLVLQQREADKLRSYSEYLVKEDTGLGDETELTEEKKKELEALKQKYLQAVKDIEKGQITQKQFDRISDQYQKELIFSGDLREQVRRAMEGLTNSIAQLKLAELDLQRAYIKSPFQGKVSEVLVSKGQKISSGADLIRVVNLKSLYLKGFALESEISHLKKGIQVRIKFDSYPDEFVYGELEAISPEIDPERKTLNIFVKVDNKENKYLPGMHAEIDVEYKVFENVIKVPRNAVVYRQERYLVFVVRDLKGSTGTAYWEYVTVGNQNDEEIEILSGVKEGDLVLIEGHQTLAHQSRVKIVK